MNQRQVLSIFNGSIGPFVQCMKQYGYESSLMSHRASDGGTLVTLPWSGPIDEYPEAVSIQMAVDLADLAANGDKDKSDYLLRALDGAKKLNITKPHLVLHRVEHWDGLDLEQAEIRMWVSLEPEPCSATGEQHDECCDNGTCVCSINPVDEPFVCLTR